MLTINKPQNPNYLTIFLDRSHVEFQQKAAKIFMVHVVKCLYAILDKLRYSIDQYSWYLQMSDIWWNSIISNFKQSWSMVWHWIYATNGQRDRTSTKMCLFFVLNRQRNHSFCPEFFQFFNLAYNYVPVSSGIQHIFFENPATKLAQMSLYKRTHQIIHLCCTIYVSL